MAKSVIIPIHTKWLDLILSGEKTTELRKVAVRPTVETILFYENGTGLITATAQIMTSGSYPIDVIWESEFFSATCVSKGQLLDYVGQQKELICIFLLYARRLKTPLTLANVGLTAAPQGYVYRDMEVPE